jgi:hypothetical protein
VAWSVAVSGGTPFAGAKTATHKFALGQALQFSPALGEDNCKRFATRLFYSSPKPGNMLQYRITSEMDGHERVVRED